MHLRILILAAVVHCTAPICFLWLRAREGDTVFVCAVYTLYSYPSWILSSKACICYSPCRSRSRTWLIWTLSVPSERCDASILPQSFGRLSLPTSTSPWPASHQHMNLSFPSGDVECSMKVHSSESLASVCKCKLIATLQPNSHSQSAPDHCAESAVV